MLRDNLVGLIEPMRISAGVDPLALSIQKHASDDRSSCLKNPRPEGVESSLTENVTSPFQAEPAQECLRQLRNHSSNARFLVLDKQKSTEDVARILIMGAHGYVSHSEAASTLIHAIRSIATNQLWIPTPVLPAFLREVNNALHKHACARQTTSPREDEILELVRRRLSNREIADFLQIRVSTVKFHLSNILSKLHASNRRELIEPSTRELWRLQ